MLARLVILHANLSTITPSAAPEVNVWIFLFSIFQRREFMNFGTGLMIGPGNVYFSGLQILRAKSSWLGLSFLLP